MSNIALQWRDGRFGAVQHLGNLANLGILTSSNYDCLGRTRRHTGIHKAHIMLIA